MFFLFHTNLLLRRNMHFPQHNVLPKTQHLVTLGQHLFSLSLYRAYLIVSNFGQLVNEIILPYFEPI